MAISNFSKQDLKKQLIDLGIKVVGNYISKKDIKTVLAGDVIPFPSKKAEWGFDLTDINSKIWKKILKLIGASETPKHDGEHSWIWKGKDVTIYTQNDPISGKYAVKNARKDEVNYASYIGIEGEKQQVEKVADLIRKYATYIKDESKGKRDFI